MTSEQSTKPTPIKQASPLDMRILANTWAGMLTRCYDPTVHSYANYGGRGIKIGSAWLKSFDRFARDVGVRPAGKSLDRINNDGHYEKGNVCWATRTEQVRNRRISLNITWNNRTMPLIRWAEELKISYACLHARIRKSNWSMDKAMLTPARIRRVDSIAFRGKTQSLAAWAREVGLSRSGLRNRILDGWSTEDALLTPRTCGSPDIEFRGVTKALHAWAKKVGISSATLHYRLDVGKWPIKKALTTPAREFHKSVAFNGRKQALQAWANEMSIPIATIRCRIRAGWSIERALTAPIDKRKAANKRKQPKCASFQGKRKSLTFWAKEYGISRRVLQQRLRTLNWSIEKALTTPVRKDKRSKP